MQTAGRTPLTPDGEVGAEDAGSRGRRRLGLFAAVALTAYAADVATKIWAVRALSPGEDRPFIGEILQLTLIRNPGAAFSTGTGYTYVFSILAMVAVVVVLYVARRVGSAVWAVALGLLLGGVSGNLTDRLLREPGFLHGHVVDFLRLPNWPVFNLADVFIDVAAGLIILQAFRGISVDGSRQPKTDS